MYLVRNQFLAGHSDGNGDVDMTLTNGPSKGLRYDLEFQSLSELMDLSSCILRKLGRELQPSNRGMQTTGTISSKEVPPVAMKIGARWLSKTSNVAFRSMKV